MSIVNKIRAGLENHLLTMPGVPPVYTSNISFDPAPKASFVKSTVVITSIQPATRGYNPQIRYTGFLSLLVCTPEGAGQGASLVLAESLLDRFAPTTDIAYDGIYLFVEDARMSPDYFTAPFNTLPVTVNWYAYNPN